jgi:hypothetical protein
MSPDYMDEKTAPSNSLCRSRLSVAAVTLWRLSILRNPLFRPRATAFLSTERYFDAWRHGWPPRCASSAPPQLLAMNRGIMIPHC